MMARRVRLRLWIREDRFLPGSIIALAVVLGVFSIAMTIVLIVTLLDRYLTR